MQAVNRLTEPKRLALGAAMVGRGEFGFLLADVGRARGLLPARLATVVVWALLWSTLSAPVAFRLAMRGASSKAAVRPARSSSEQN